ncbi:MAG: S-layer homology domain-containing protein [Peptoniphilus sp. oral taxon 375]|nr:S-layer homology domain-containing protein [Peptoniphilus sp. oral taxon 375]
MKKKILASLLAGIVLATSILPTASFAQEDLGLEKTQAKETSQEDKRPVSKDLAQLRFFVDGKEYFLRYPFRRDEKEYRIALPAGTKEVTIRAIPADARAKVWLGAGEDAKEIQGDYSFKTSYEEKVKNKGYNDRRFTDTANFYISEEKPAENDQSIRYSVSMDIPADPGPVITGVKNHYVFKKGQKVTKEDLLKGVKAFDENGRDITSKITIGDKYDWFYGQINTLEIKDTPKNFRFQVYNQRGQMAYVDSKYSVVAEDDIVDRIKPVITVPKEEVLCYEGDIFTKEDLLKGVTAYDDVDKDLTDKIQVDPEELVINRSNPYPQGSLDEFFVTYTVQDKAGNKAEKRISYFVKKTWGGLDQEDKIQKIQDLLRKILPRYTATGGGDQEDWNVVNLGMVGREDLVDKSALLTSAQDLVSTNPKKATDYERTILALTAAGFDVQNFPIKDGKKINLIDTLAKHEPMEDNNDYIFALLAYDSGNYSLSKDAKWTREALIQTLLDRQLPYGGWDLHNPGEILEPDITAMAIQALAPYKDRPGVKKALDKALDILSGNRSKDFGYYSVENVETSETTAQVLLALVSMGIDPKDDPRFSYYKQDVVDGLLSFVTGDQDFVHVKVAQGGYTVGPNAMSTQQAFQALAAYQNFKKKGGKAPYYPFRFKDFSQEKPGENPSKPDKPIDPDTIITLRDLEILSLPYKTSYEEGEEPSLDGLKVRASYSDGTSEILQNRALNVFDFSTSSWSPNRIVTIAYGGLKTTFSIQVKEKEGTYKDQANILVKDPKGRTYFPAQNLSIRSGEDTAFSLLQKTGLTYKYNYHKTYSGVYVSAIEGLAEFDGGPNSGWMYRVNGSFPNHSASLHKIYAGDKVEWLYTRDLGKDLGAKMEETDNYTITVRHNQGGTVSPSGAIKVQKGQNLSLRILPDKGYVIDKVLVDGQDQGKIESYSFYSVDKDHRVDVSFVQVKDLETNDFTNTGNKTLRDIPGHWAQGAMTYCLDKGYFAGKGDGTFGANDPVSRGDFVTVLGRRRKVVVKAEKSFKDVNPNAYYGPYVAWSKKQGLAHGYGGNFRPKDSMTREEMAKVFQDYLKAEKKLSKREKRTFKDQRKISSWAKESVDTLTSQGILVGDQKGNFNPKQTLTRAQVAQVLYQIDQQ